MTFNELAEIVMEQRAKDGIRGAKSERHRLRLHVATAPFATKDLTEIRPVDIVQWGRLMSEKKARDTRGDRTLSSATVRRSMAFASAVFSVAVENGIINVNPCFGVRARRRSVVEETKDKWSYLTIEEQRAILHCPDLDEADRLTILFALYTGMRQGEQFNLELRDLHVDEDDNPHVYVRFGSPGLPPKSGKTRRVPLFGEGLRVAKAWLEMLPKFAPRNPEKLVFPTRNGKRRGVGKPLGRAKVKGKNLCAWKAALKTAGIKRNIRWHDLRHSCASSLLAGWWGRVWTTEEIRELLGHSSIKISERYAHLGEDSLRRAARETGAAQMPAAAPPAASPPPRDDARAFLRRIQRIVSRVA